MAAGISSWLDGYLWLNGAFGARRDAFYKTHAHTPVVTARVRICGICGTGDLRPFCNLLSTWRRTVLAVEKRHKEKVNVDNRTFVSMCASVTITGDSHTWCGEGIAYGTIANIS